MKRVHSHTGFIINP